MRLNLKKDEAEIEIEDMDNEDCYSWNQGCRLHFHYSYHNGGSGCCIKPEEVAEYLERYTAKAKRDGLKLTIVDKRAKAKLDNWF